MAWKIKKAQAIYTMALFAIAAVLTGCAYCGYSLKGGSIPPQAQTIQVDYFPNNATQVNPVLSQLLTEKLRDKFLRETRLKATKADPDMHFSGRITGYSIAPVGVSGSGQAQTSRLTITVRAKFESKYSPKNNFDTDFTAYGDFPASQSFAAIESTLADDICNRLVQEIFNRSILDW